MAEPSSSSAQSTPEPDLSGRRLGDYRLLRRLGRGNMAEVYLAEQGSLRRMVAVKVLRRSLASDESYVRRLHNEAQAAAALVHANIVQIYEVGCVDGIHFIAQEYVPGQNLRELLARRGALDVKTAVVIMRQVAAALQKASREAIVHRDIKPENIMLAKGGEVKVADFGLARFTREGAGVDLTQVGVTMGTPLYMSPEQVEGRKLDPRSDIYSFGVTCYQMLAGRPPFEGDSALSVAVQHLKKAPPPLEEIRPDLPPALCRTVHKMLAKDPDQRHQRPAELLQELRLLKIEGSAAEEAGGEEDWSEPELIALADARLEATQKLDAVMKTEAEAARKRRGLALWLLAPAATAFLLGCAAAWLSLPPSLLETAPGSAAPVPRMDSAMAQYYYAVGLDNEAAAEAALKSVAEFFPPQDNPNNAHYCRLATLRLAEIRAGDGDYDRALQYYAELANLDDSETQLKAFGLAGQANVLLLQGNTEQAKGKLFRLAPLYRKLDNELQTELRRQLEPQLRPPLDEFLRQQNQTTPAAKADATALLEAAPERMSRQGPIL